MCAVPFNDLHKDDLKLKDLQKIQKMVKERIPTGDALAKSACKRVAQNRDSVESTGRGSCSFCQFAVRSLSVPAMAPELLAYPLGDVKWSSVAKHTPLRSTCEDAQCPGKQCSQDAVAQEAAGRSSA